jgi:dimethylhistidine N-methyltransferase
MNVSVDTEQFRHDLIEGLSRTPMTLPPKWFYDAEGSRLFEDITRLDEYYPTRQEAALLEQVASDWASRFVAGAVLVEFGSGASEKTRKLLDAAPQLSAYVPLDISHTALQDAAERIADLYPDLKVVPVVGDFQRLPPVPPQAGPGPRIGFFPGSTIGNLEPAQAVAFLSNAREMLGEGALFILGLDLVKAEDVLVAAYDDASGVTAAFNRNMLVRANRELGADFDVDGFDHLAVWNAEHSRMEMHLVARRAMDVTVGGRRFRFAAGDAIHTESSRKFTRETVMDMAAASGWRIEAFEQSAEPSVALVLLKAD